MFNHDFSDKQIYSRKNGNIIFTSKILEKLWPFGFNTIGSVTEASAMYQAQYTQKDIKNGNYTNEKKSHSKHSGIGRDFFLRHYKQILSLGFIPFGGKKIAIPRYFYKLAHKHYSHFHAPENFFDYPDRKKLYTPFKTGEESRDISEHFIQYSKNRQPVLNEYIEQWFEDVKPYIWSREKPPFRLAAENYLHDLSNRNIQTDP